MLENKSYLLSGSGYYSQKANVYTDCVSGLQESCLELELSGEQFP